MRIENPDEITLLRVWNDYKQNRDLNPSTIKNYLQRLDLLVDWWHLPINQINKDMALMPNCSHA